MAVAHAETLKKVVPADVSFWKVKDRNLRENRRSTVLNIVDAALRMHIASRLPKSDIAHVVENFRAWLASLGWCAEVSQS